MKRLAFTILLMSALASCGKTEKPTPDEEPVPIRIATTMTRATDNAFETGDKVGVFVVSQPGTIRPVGNHVDNCGFSFDGTQWNAGRQIYWPDAATKCDFYCYYPYASTISSVDAFPFKVSLDQRGESGYKASDFLWGKVTGVSPTPDPVMITVSHRMSCLIVNLKAGTGWKESDLSEAEVKLNGLKASAVINLGEGVVTACGDTSEIRPNPIGGNSFRALVPPQKVTDSDLVRIKLGDSSYSLKTTIDLKSGRQHTCTVVVNRTGEGINIGIGPWETDDIDYGGTVE